MNVTLVIDGKTMTVTGSWERNLLSVMRDDLDIMAAKPGCEIGRCGACTIILNGEPANACLLPMGRLDGATITTAEGLDRATIEALIAIMREEHIAQCGYCSNGLLVTLASLVSRMDEVGRDESRLLLAGHICRCTGAIALDRALERILSLHASTKSIP